MRKIVEKKIENLLECVNDDEVVVVIGADMKENTAGSGHVGEMAEVTELFASMLLRPQSDHMESSDDIIQMSMMTAFAAANLRTKGRLIRNLKIFEEKLDESGYLISEEEFNALADKYYGEN